jgi:hypothetical protein
MDPSNLISRSELSDYPADNSPLRNRLGGLLSRALRWT